MTMEKDMSAAANNSSDFVRKLYKMLEDPTYSSIVRWGEGGESFVVLENEKFTKSILPKHFKHSNFASFVRQLNKYDFHKVRQNNEDNAPSPYGPNAWEFKHPEFQANKKDSLDNIRRKAPTQRKQTQSVDDQYPAQQIDLLNSQLTATQQQLTHMSDKYQDLAQGHVVLLQQVVELQKFVKNHDNVMHRVMGFLHSVDAQRRNSRTGAPFGSGMGSGDQMPNDGPLDDHPASPLQQASDLLQEFSAENLPNKELEQMTHEYAIRNEYSTPPNDHSSSTIAPHSDNSSAHLGFSLGNDLDSMVYPVGHTNGIDPINSEHIHNIPYSLPPNGMLPINPMPEIAPQGNLTSSRKKSGMEPIWGINKPRVLLVEDDRMCAKIGSKFLQNFECGVEVACDGLEAVNKINAAPHSYNLVLMDIIMPNLDGVSATVLIREIRPDLPIIAMTSNIRADDIDMYFRYGMAGVLPKPFTKEGMLRSLQKHLPSFLKPAPYQDQPAMAGGFSTPGPSQPPLGLNMSQLSAAQSLKDDTSPGKSPVTTGSWHSPNQITGQSPVGNQPLGYMQPTMREQHPYAMTPTHPHPQSGFPIQPTGPMGPGRGPPHRRVMSDMTGGPAEDHPEKRQRMYPPPTGGFQ